MTKTESISMNKVQTQFLRINRVPPHEQNELKVNTESLSLNKDTQNASDIQHDI